MKMIMDPDQLPPSTLLELHDFLRRSGSNFNVADALTAAVKHWIASELAVTMPPRGYQWKSVFLPVGTRVRLQCGEGWDYAEIQDDKLIYCGRAVSPHQLTSEVAGKGRSAWRALWLMRPGDRHWLPAERLRRELAQAAPVQPPTPYQALQNAAHGMRHALQSALALVEHVRLQNEHAVERRVARHRRRDDFLQDDCAAD